MGKQACVPQLLKPEDLEPGLCKKGSRPSEKPSHCTYRKPLHSLRDPPRSKQKIQNKCLYIWMQNILVRKEIGRETCGKKEKMNTCPQMLVCVCTYIHIYIKYL